MSRAIRVGALAVVGLSALGWWACGTAPEPAGRSAQANAESAAASEASAPGGAVLPRVTGTLPPLQAAGNANGTASAAAPASAIGAVQLEAEADAETGLAAADAAGADAGDARPSQPKSLTTFADVKSALAAASPAIRGCYEQALAHKPKMQGKVLVSYVIAERDGKSYIREASIEEEDSDPEMLDPFFGMCVLKAVGDVEHAVPVDEAGEKSGEVRVRMPYRFAPGDEE